MPPAAAIPDALRGKVFRGTVVIKRGLLTRDQLRSSAWRRISRDVYADAQLTVNHGLAIAAARVILPASAVLAGRSAAWIYGVKHAGSDDPVDVLAPIDHFRRAPERISVHVEHIPPADVQQLGRRRVTTCARTCVDIARWYEPVVAVPMIDALIASRQVRAADWHKHLGTALGADLGHAQQTLALCDGRAESPPESVLRVRLILAGLPAPVPQHEVHHNGRFVARVDLGWPERRVAVEYDGARHGATGQLGRDRRRLNALIAAGWIVVHVTAADMHHLAGVIEQLRTLLLMSA